MKFSGIKSLDELVKEASLEVLLKRVIVEADKGTTVYPSNCPGVGRTEDYGKDESGKPACVSNNNNCPYFEDAMFNLSDYYKQIGCKIKQQGE